MKSEGTAARHVRQFFCVYEGSRRAGNGSAVLRDRKNLSLQYAQDARRAAPESTVLTTSPYGFRWQSSGRPELKSDFWLASIFVWLPLPALRPSSLLESTAFTSSSG